jgi:hypothetical protein
MADSGGISLERMKTLDLLAYNRPELLLAVLVVGAFDARRAPADARARASAVAPSHGTVLVRARG